MSDIIIVGTERTVLVPVEVASTGPVGPAGPQGPAGQGPAGTGLVSVTGGAYDTPSTLSARVAADAPNLRTQLGLGTVATQNANAVVFTGGTLQDVGVVTGGYTSRVNEALMRSCRKASAGTITKGQVVYVTGSTGSHLEVELADADTELTSSKTFGVAAEDLTNSTEGYVIVEGMLTGLSNLPSASFTTGASLWLSSTAGGWQTTPPANPAHGVYLGRVVNASNGSNGSAFIKIQNGYELDELHDVVITTPADKEGLFYEGSTQLWKNRLPVLGDLGQSGAATGQSVQWNGTAWVPVTPDFVPKQRYRTLWVGAGAMTPPSTGGPATATIQTTTNGVTYDIFKFDGATAENLWFNLRMPDEWDRGTVKAVLCWEPDTSGTGAVVWGVAGVADSDNDVIDTALGTEVTIADSVLAVGRLHVTAATAAITIGGSPALGDVIAFRVRRIPTDAGDTMTQDACLLGVAIQWREGTTEPVAW